MTDEEYREYLTALTGKHLRMDTINKSAERLSYDVEHLSSVARFARLMTERTENEILAKALSDELRNAYVDNAVRTMEQTGVLAALDESPEITFGNMRRSAIPEEDVRMLGRAGVDDPEAEITLLIHFSRTRLANQNGKPSETVRQAPAELKSAAERIATASQNREPPAKKRKIFSGVGRLLTGVITAAGNLLLVTGTVIAPNPAIAYAVLGSSALAAGSILSGIGDLRGE
jgi:hypothetical protein